MALNMGELAPEILLLKLNKKMYAETACESYSETTQAAVCTRRRYCAARSLAADRVITSSVRIDSLL